MGSSPPELAHHFLVRKVHLAQAADAFNTERRARPYDSTIVATAQPFRYQVAAG